MNCPHCGHDSRVIETRAQEGNAVLRRRRECLGPATHRFTTYEQLAPAADTPMPASAVPVRRRMPRERESVTHKFSIAGHEGYITAGKYEDGSLGEIFLTDIGKEGSTLRGMLNAFATAISIGLQYGVPLETFLRKFSYMRFDPEGTTTNPEIPVAKSMPDYIMRWLGSRFIDNVDALEELGILTPEVRARNVASVGRLQRQQAVRALEQGRVGEDQGGPPCPRCGAAMHGAGDSFTCPSCGFSSAPEALHQPGLRCVDCGSEMRQTGTGHTCPRCGESTVPD